MSGHDARVKIAVAIAAGFAAWPSAAYASLPAASVRAGDDLTGTLGQWLVDKDGTHWTPPWRLAASSVVRPQASARRYDAHGNRADFELAAPPPAAETTALDLPAAAPVQVADAAGANAKASDARTGVFERLVAGAAKPSILLAAAASPGESAADIEARVDRRMRAARPHDDSAPASPAASAAQDASKKDPRPAPLAAVFETESAEVDPDLGQDLDAFADWMKATPGARATATGHAGLRAIDRTGDEAAIARARRLAESRALALRQELLSRGVAASSVSIDARVAAGTEADAASLEPVAAKPPAPAPSTAAEAATPAVAAPAHGRKSASPPRRLVPPAPGA